MFEPQANPRVFSVSVGCDFAKSFVNGLLDRFKDQPPEYLGRVQIFVNTRRMERRIHGLLLQQGALLLPKIRLITDVPKLPNLPIHMPAAVPPLRRRLQLAQLVRALLAQEPDLAPESTVFDLAASLAELLDEMQGEGVAFEKLETVNVEGMSGHWERSLQFLRILAAVWDPVTPVDPQDRQRQSALALAEFWQTSPPDHPVIVAGSTGSRGASAAFMRAVAQLPQGAVVLPGVDLEMPREVWGTFADPRVTMDHPQFGVFKFCRALELEISEVPNWAKDSPVSTSRNRLISLALRPAPFTDQWLEEGPNLISELAAATQNIALVEAKTPKDEARALAIRLRETAQTGQSAVLISPDRHLTRRVTAALARWHISPDDSAGRPLHQSPPGIFLRLLAGTFGERLTPLALVSLLKHPLCARSQDTGDYRRYARDLERQELRGGAPFVDFSRLANWADKKEDTALKSWTGWIRDVFAPLAGINSASLQEWLTIHRTAAELLAAGPGEQGSGELWLKEAGKQAEAIFAKLAQETDVAGELSATDYKALFLQVLHDADVRDSITPHPFISIMGPREAREQGADLVILAGLNETTWPKIARPDPWLSQAMRAQIGLSPAERQIGLSAQDFQQAVSAPEVILSRSLRDGDAPTVASRWLIRLLNLLGGLGDVGEKTMRDMRSRGQVLLSLASTLDQPENPVQRACRPAPRPPLSARPKQLSVTRIKTLIRDPYAIYASSILRLKPLPPLGKEPDALARGIAIHEVLEVFSRQTLEGLPPDASDLFLRIAREVLQEKAPWPADRRFWLARLARIADWFVQTEQERRSKAQILVLERSGKRTIDELAFTLTATADRIDLDSAGNLLIYDYKSGKPPSVGVIRNFDKQVQLEAAIAQAGGFDEVDARPVERLEYIGIGATAYQSTGEIHVVDIVDQPISTVWQEFQQLIESYQSPEQGYSARARMQMAVDISDFDHLSRRGEWEDSDSPKPEQVP